ncbi:hypothetical protein BGZ63DRAFT_426519 [Mariannaea sp. PMI_226]|nr:hypothetical protein BGZ63DRAFT_426519 [Mariannaea sp. PMI_226]
MASDSLSLAGKVAIVTGSGKENGIGAAIAMALARAGARVTINYVSESTAARAQQTVKNIEAVAGRNTALIVQADISTPEGTKRLVDETLRGFAVTHIDIIVNNASWIQFGPALETTPEELNKAFAINVFGPLYLIQAAMPYMSKGGRIINIGSVVSKLGLVEGPIYDAIKGAMDALTFALAHEIGRGGKGLTINTIAPGPTPTDTFPEGNPGADVIKNHLRSLTRAEDRLGSVQDIADAVLLLVSEKARWITGQFVSVSGGITGG